MDVTSFFFSVDKQPPVLFQTWQMIMYNVHSIISINRFIFFHKCTAQKVEGSLISLLNKCFKGNQLFLKVYKYQKRKRLLLSISGNINLDFTYLYLNDSSRCYYRQIVISSKVLKSHYFKLR